MLDKLELIQKLTNIVLLRDGRSVSWSVGCLVGRSVGWSVGQSVGCLVGRSVAWSVSRLVG
jgi:hypothetical protein